MIGQSNQSKIIGFDIQLCFNNFEIVFTFKLCFFFYNRSTQTKIKSSYKHSHFYLAFRLFFFSSFFISFKM